MIIDYIAPRKIVFKLTWNVFTNEGILLFLKSCHVSFSSLYVFVLKLECTHFYNNVLFTYLNFHYKQNAVLWFNYKYIFIFIYFLILKQSDKYNIIFFFIYNIIFAVWFSCPNTILVDVSRQIGVSSNKIILHSYLYLLKFIYFPKKTRIMGYLFSHIIILPLPIIFFYVICFKRHFLWLFKTSFNHIHYCT